MTPEERFNRLDDFVARGAVIRGAWTSGDDRACLLAALSPEAGEKESASACPADVIPRWLAEMTPDLEDSGSDAAWPAFVRRYAAVIRRSRVLTAEDWRRTDFAVRAGILRVALPHAGAATAVVQSVIELCERATRGEAVTGQEWAAARAAACGADWDDAAREAAASAMCGAAAWDRAACAAAGDAAASAMCGAAAWDRAAGDAAGDAAWDAIATLTLDAIDAACVAREAVSP